MINTVVMTQSYFESKEMHCQTIDGKDNLLLLNIRAENLELKVLMDFTEDGKYVTIKIYNLCKFPADKTNQMYKLCSELNKEYKWAKFYVDESDNTLTAQDDAIIQLDTCGAECYELSARLVLIVDEVYPRMMKTIWQ